MKPKEAEQIIKKDGWREVRSNNGSHKQYKHPDKKEKSPYPSTPAILPPERCTV
jgi:predicted RNA binding protein YcfA (HicA-like mRNA interferase family)